MGRFGLFHGPFWSWPRAVLVVTVGRFRRSENLWAVLVGAVLVHGPFWYRPAYTLFFKKSSPL